MPRFKIEFERTWTETDYLERVIEAATIEEARERASEMANEYDQNCPDDTTSSKGGVAGDWGVEEVTETEEELSDV